MKSRIYRLSLLGVVLGAFTVNVAIAGTPATREVNTANIAVSFEDLNLARPAGVSSLHHRVEAAARNLCGVENFRVSLDIERKNRECVSATTISAMSKIDDGGFSAMPRKQKTAINRF